MGVVYGQLTFISICGIILAGLQKCIYCPGTPCPFEKEEMIMKRAYINIPVADLATRQAYAANAESEAKSAFLAVMTGDIKDARYYRKKKLWVLAAIETFRLSNLDKDEYIFEKEQAGTVVSVSYDQYIEATSNEHTQATIEKFHEFGRAIVKASEWGHDVALATSDYTGEAKKFLNSVLREVKNANNPVSLDMWLMLCGDVLKTLAELNVTDIQEIKSLIVFGFAPFDIV